MQRSLRATMVAALSALAAVHPVPAQAQDPAELRLLREEYYAAKACEDNLKLVEPFTVNIKEYYKAVPGAFETFRFIEHLNAYFGDDLRNVPTVSAFLFTYLRRETGADTLTCEDLDDWTRQNPVNGVKQGAACAFSTILAECVIKMNEVHLSHFGKRNRDWQNYNSTLGVYSEWQYYRNN